MLYNYFIIITFVIIVYFQSDSVKIDANSNPCCEIEMTTLNFTNKIVSTCCTDSS